MVKLSLKTKKKISVIQISKTSYNPLLLFREGMKIPSNNSDGDRKRIMIYVKH